MCQPARAPWTGNATASAGSLDTDNNSLRTKEVALLGNVKENNKAFRNPKHGPEYLTIGMRQPDDNN